MLGRTSERPVPERREVKNSQFAVDEIVVALADVGTGHPARWCPGAETKSLEWGRWYLETAMGAG
jgi:hypothetical protein